MRVIAGSARSIPLKCPQGARPTTDRVKEGMFGVIQFDIAGAKVLDLFAGSGALGIEALSRGAASCLFVDASAASLEIVRENLQKTRLTERAQCRRGDYQTVLDSLKEPFDLVFLDPPYAAGYYQTAVRQLLDAKLLNQGGQIVVESDREEILKGGLTQYIRKIKRYGGIYVTYLGSEENNK